MNHIAAANRVASMIATVKWVVIGLVGLAVLIGFISSITEDAPGIGVVALLVGAVYGFLTYVFFGWLEQTLRMLATIAVNTTPGAGAPVSPYAG